MITRKKHLVNGPDQAAETYHLPERETPADRRARAGHRERVLKMWQFLTKENKAPCSIRRAADIVGAMYGENFFSPRQFNKEVIAKRTVELAERGQVVELIDCTDPDGRIINHYRA